MSGFGSHSTAEEVLGDRSLEGKRAIVTGGAAGLGAETARVLSLGGASVTIACRSVEAGEAAAKQIKESSHARGEVRVRALDLADPKSIRAFADAEGGPVDLLINNAGVMATPLGLTAAGYETQMGTNHLGHFLLTKLLLPKLAKTARVVTLSSSRHKAGTGDNVVSTLTTDRRFEKRKYVPFDAYGDSKLANILFTKALAKRLPEGVLAFAVHPGVIPTNLSRHMGVGGAVFRAVGGLFMKNVPRGAATTIYGAIALELEGRSGAYLADCAVTEPSSFATDAALAERVWALSEEAVAT